MTGQFHYVSSRLSPILFFVLCISIPTIITLLFAFHFLFSSPGQVTQLKEVCKLKIHRLRTIGDNISASCSQILLRESLNPRKPVEKGINMRDGCVQTIISSQYIYSAQECRLCSESHTSRNRRENENQEVKL